MQTEKKGGAQVTTIAENEIYENVYKTTQPYAGELKISTKLSTAENIWQSALISL